MNVQSNEGNLDALSFKAIFAIFSLFGLIPKNTAVRLAGILGYMWFVIDHRHRKVAIENLSYMYGSRKKSIF